ncbi:MAG: hypothetical protein A2566_01980 [Candidatus Zambryskibacteria bacterium RIFOXYD1_FULL_40_13]|nr:MAG: hypothetical protein UT25_C0003G0088 [Parcubacteria group bacterium GW2011_GWC1_39_12]KKR18972.1 MAG: hypothetical protein UT49_C0005G0039 [Parcubacteria group bacterium GW2011_GWF1_39_37]KKR35472.1 MAG: hypothetical protein UT68_C0003G0043 [Parcubacteria group bacterium GW2011_GWC2_40_10]KKR51962.1 MAG: hypothetical protein UT89_C0004G0042 [Parcubacteria group bacterium GW2011_GWE1_40_20]KKR64885.1 MAG: hypothetical protein UU06_C0036G0010 [Parcubacteria group bacterium GW2011_GWB1_40_
MESENKISTEISIKSLDAVSFFDKDADFVLAYKKTEKLVSAMYMITGLFSDSEPMKWTLRKKSGELLSFVLTYKDTPEGGRGDFVYYTKTRTLELISLLEISARGGLVSQMNFSILKQEFFNLINILKSTDLTLAGTSDGGISQVFSEGFSVSSDVMKGAFVGEKIYRQTEQENAVQRVSLSDIKDRNINTNKDNLKKTNRQNIILALLKKKKELTINDIAVVIKDCSEKTIQRELNSFISAGVLKRSGVRRWSRYSLV